MCCRRRFTALSALLGLGGEYGPYLIPPFFTGDGNSTTIFFTMSTWNPYNIVLMPSTLQREVRK